MVNVGVKATDTGFQSVDAGKGKSSSTKGTSSDQFRKLLEGTQDNTSSDNKSQEVTKDVTQEKAEASEEVKDNPTGDSKTDTKEDGDTAKTEESSQAQEMLAAYQISQGLRPELLQAEPEVVIEVPELTQTEPVTEAVDVTEVMDAADQTVDMISTDNQADFQEVTSVHQVQADAMIPAESKVQETNFAKEPEVQMSDTVQTTQEAPVTKPQEREVRVNHSEGQRNTQTENQSVDHAAAAMTQTPERTVVEDVKPQEIVTVEVPHAEELPDKVADQLLSKMSEGVQEFEIHLEPENLGKIAVKVLYEDGQATVSILCTEKKTLELLGNNAREMGNIIERNLGGETKIFVEKQENDYLNQTKDENQQGKQEEQKQQKEQGKKEDMEDTEQFLQKLRLGLMG